MQESAQSKRPVKFGAFEADLAARELRKNGAKVRLQDQPFQVLALLLENPCQVVTREELRQKLWSADTFVDFDNGLNTCINKIREALGDTAEKPRFVETLPRRGYRFIGAQPTGAGIAAKQIESLVVLPLENLSRDAEQEYFADGLTETLITNLAKISALRVVSRTTAMHYKGVHRPLPQIARELEVDAVVEGTVQRSGQRVRISAQLVQASTDAHLWAESYERDLRDVLELQAEVARAIANEIKVKLTPQEQKHLTRARQVDPEAYEAYLKGRFHWNKRTLEGFTKAAEYFQQAIDKDAGYAAAHAGLADTASRLGWWGFVRPEDGCARAKAAAKKALEIDDTLAEAYAALGFATLFYDYSPRTAERQSRRATELDPKNPTAAQALGVCLAALGCLEEGISEVLRAIQLDPLSPMLHWTAGILMYQARRYDQVIAQSRKGLELDSAFPSLHWNIGLALLAKGIHEEGLKELEYAAQVANRFPYFLGTLGYGYGVTGRTEDARKVVSELSSKPLSSYWIGMIYASLNDSDSALDFLERAYLERVPWLAYANVAPWFDNLRSNPRFEDLLHRMNSPS
jgi:TolB-like protein